jgi:hypothetical protein
VSGRLALAGHSTLLGVSTRTRTVSSVERRIGRVGNLGGPLLGHALFLEGFVLLLLLTSADSVAIWPTLPIPNAN